VTRVIGLDHGTRRIGVAVGDTETGMAFPREAIRHRGAAGAAESVRELAADEDAALVVLGLPRAEDGGEGEQAAIVRAFGARLEELGLRVTYEDERLSSWAASEALENGGRRAPRQSGALDSAAARLILQQYLDAHRLPGRLEETE
jgi:putative Holliday junction resolvase